MPDIGLIGYPLSHSFSQKYFTVKFDQLGLKDWQYHLFPLKDIDDLTNIFIQYPELLGFNVTIPYKETILDYCDVLSDEVKAIGAANVVIISKNEKLPILTAHNTDYLAFKNSLERWQTNFKKALILGNGGASKAIQYALQTLEIDFKVVTRHGKFTYNELNDEELQGYDLLINCTPVGTIGFPEEYLPIKLSGIHSQMYFYDLVYNPSQTPMMSLFESKGAKVKNGLEMLHLQADYFWELFGDRN
jgi:shikimate dehydrogenase